MSPPFQNELSQVPVTALAHPWLDIVLAGQGTILRIYDRESAVSILSTRLFASQAIHGFTWIQSDLLSTISLLAWGGRYLCFCVIVRDTRRKTKIGYEIYLQEKTVTKISDWIFDVAFQPSADASGTLLNAVLVTAHNEIFDVKISPSSKSSERAETSLKAERSFSGPRCGLYSACLQWLSPQKLLVVSGTAFGEIVVWTMHLQETKIEARKHYVFTGHEGSIFGVRTFGDWSGDEQCSLRLLGSCSDDRTVRVWNISDLNGGVVLDRSATELSNHDTTRTTGFLNYVSEEAAESSSQLCIATGMGHLSRIWDIRFGVEKSMEHRNDYVCSIISVGEDATCQTWRLERTSKHYKLLPGTVNALHDGKNLWAMSTSDLASHSFVLTGGADGKIVEHFSLSAAGDDSNQRTSASEWTIDRALAALVDDRPLANGAEENQKCPISQRTGKSKAESFRSFAAIGDSQVLLTTNEGLMLLASSYRTTEWSWKQIGSFEGLKGYSVSCHLEAEPFEYVFFGDAQGNIYYYHSFFESIRLLTTIDGKITKIVAEILPSRTHEYMSIVVTRHGGEPPVQLRINLGTGGTIWLASTRTFAKWTSEFPHITSAVIATHGSDEKGIIVGCRDGSIRSYSNIESTRKREFDFDLPSVHAREAVTAMTWLPYAGHQENLWNPSLGWLYSVGRDGTLAIHQFKEMYLDPVLVHRLSLSFGPNLEGVSLDSSTLDVSVWGFTSKYFICQNVSAQEDVVTVECGGAHRIWNFAPLDSAHDGSGGGLFSWVKAMKLNLAKISGSSHKVIQSGGHGREIKACAVAPMSIHRGLGPLIATGAEDTDIAISYYVDWHGEQKQLKRLTTLRKHVTGVQALHWSTDGHFLFSCGGFEEFYVWQLRPAPGVSIGIVCESKCPMDNADSELRITDFAVRDVSVRQPTSLGDEEWVFLISLVYSDSKIKVWKYTSTTSVVPNRETWSFVATSQYTTACLTTAAYLSASTNGWPLIAGSTDGHLSFWSLSEKTRDLACEGLQSLHQSSVKAIASIELSESSWIIASGGDDNALGLTVLSFDDETEELHSSSLLVPSAHAAAITAVGIVETAPNFIKPGVVGLRLITAGNDQRVKQWDVTFDRRKVGVRGLEVKRTGNIPSSVADISSLAIFDTRKRHAKKDTSVLISGVGTEVWNIP